MNDIVGALRRAAESADRLEIRCQYDPKAGQMQERARADAKALRDLVDHIERGGLFAQLVADFEMARRAGRDSDE